jgi:hypothetical protein
LNAAYIPKAHVLLFSTTPNPIRAALDSFTYSSPSLAGDRAMQSTAAALGIVASALLEPVHGSCIAYGPTKSLAADIVASRRALHRYATFGIGYRTEAGRSLGIAALNFSTAAAAIADLPVRRGLAATGRSAVNGVPYSASVYTLKSAATSGNTIMFLLQPKHDSPSLLFSMVLRRDVLFALCP